MGGTIDGHEEMYDRCGEMVSVKVPSQIENIRFFLSYQCNFMYWRYFMWNFAGRQNDIQEMVNWSMATGSVDSTGLTTCDWVTRTHCLTS